MAIEYVEKKSTSISSAWIGDPALPSGRRIAIAWMVLDIRYIDVWCWAYDVFTIWNDLPPTGSKAASGGDN